MGLFGFGNKKEVKKESNCNNATAEAADETKKAGGIKVLGGGCAKCHELEVNTKAALAELGINENVELITDFSAIATYGIMSTPALVIDNKVACYGKVLKEDEVVRMIREARSV